MNHSRTQRRIAFHEAGHMSASFAMGGYASASIGRGTGCAHAREFYPSRHIITAAGHAAERIRWPRGAEPASGLDMSRIPPKLRQSSIDAATTILRAWWPLVGRFADALERDSRLTVSDAKAIWKEMRTGSWE